MNTVTMQVKFDSCGSTLTLKHADGRKKKVFVAGPAKESYVPPDGWKIVNETHWMGQLDDFPVLKKAVGRRLVVELPANFRGDR